MSVEEAMSGGNGNVPPANPTSKATVPAGADPTGSDPEGGSGTGARLAAWTQQLSKETRENPELAKRLAGIEKLDDFAQKYFELESRSAVPDAGAKPEEAEAFWRRLGYPEKPEGYSASADKDAGTFLSLAHAGRLTDGQASAMWKATQEQAGRRHAELRQAQAREMAEADAALRKEYGGRYDYAMEMLKRGIGGMGPELQAAGLAGKPEIIRAFIALGEARREDYSPKGESSPGTADHMNSPWELEPRKKEENKWN